MVGERRRLRRRRGVGRGVARVAAPFVVLAVVVVLAAGTVARIGPASGPERRTVDRSYAVLAGPVMAQSNASGSALNAILTKGPTLDRTTFFSDLTSIADTALEDERRLAALSPPVPGGDVAARCEATMEGRQRATAEVEGGLEGLLGGRLGRGGGDEAKAARAVTGAGAVLRRADASWAACRRSLRLAAGSAVLPTSKWISDPGLWEGAAVGGLVADLVSSASLTPVHRLAIVTVSTEPAAVAGASGLAVLPPTNFLHVRIVVADQGNVDERGVRIVVRAVPPGTARAPAPVRVLQDIGTGDSVTVLPPPLTVRPATTYVLDITATGAGAAATASTSFSLRVSVVTTTTTTTTAPPARTTTVPTTRTTATTKPGG